MKRLAAPHPDRASCAATASLLSPWLGSTAASSRPAPPTRSKPSTRMARWPARRSTLGRLARCHPWCAGGHDPVPAHAPRLFSSLLAPNARRPPRPTRPPKHRHDRHSPHPAVGHLPRLALPHLRVVEPAQRPAVVVRHARRHARRRAVEPRRAPACRRPPCTVDRAGRPRRRARAGRAGRRRASVPPRRERPVTTDVVEATLDSAGGTLTRRRAAELPRPGPRGVVRAAARAVRRRPTEGDAARRRPARRVADRLYVAESGLVPAAGGSGLPNHHTAMTLVPGPSARWRPARTRCR